MMRLIVIICLTFLSCSIFSQNIATEYFKETGTNSLDHVNGYLKMEDGIVLGGCSKIGDEGVLTIVKVNKEGDVIWTADSTIIADNGLFYCNCQIKIYDFNDGFLWVIDKQFYDRHLWKIEANSGHVVFVKEIYENESLTDTPSLVNYDSQQIISHLGNKVVVYDKDNGEELINIELPYTNWDNGSNITIDRDSNVYVAIGSSIKKYNRLNFDQKIWELPYDDLLIYEVHKIYFDEYGSLFVFGADGFGGNSYPFISRINKQTGAIIWTRNIDDNSQNDYHTDVLFSSLVDTYDKLFVTYKHQYFGGSDHNFITTKVSKGNGGIDWLSFQSVTGIMNQNNEQAAFSIDLDCSNNVYLTGYYNSVNNGPGIWGSMKLNGATGNKMYDFSVTLDSTGLDDSSSGIAACIYNDAAIFIGNSQYQLGLDSVKPFFVRIHPPTGQIIVKKTIDFNSSLSSKTIKIIEDNNKIFVLKQRGKRIVVEAKSSPTALLWSTSFSDSTNFIATQFYAKNNFIYLLGYKTLSLDSIKAEQIFIYKIDVSNGIVLNHYSTVLSDKSLIPYELEIDNNALFIFLKNKDVSYFVRMDDLGFWNKVFLDSIHYLEKQNGEIDLCSNLNSTTLLVFGKDHIYQIEKISVTKSIVYTYPLGSRFYCFEKVDDNYYLLGENIEGNEYLLLFNSSTQDSLWTKVFNSNSTILQSTLNEPDFLYTVSNNLTNVNINKIGVSEGDLLWARSFMDSLSISTKSTDVDYSVNSNSLFITGFSINSDSTSNAHIHSISSEGDFSGTWIGREELGGISRTNTVCSTIDNHTWIGGSLNTIQLAKSGFVFVIDSISDTLAVHGLSDKIEGNLTIFPNPTESIININGLHDKFDFEVYDIAGRIHLIKNSCEVKSIDLSGLCPGNYFLKIKHMQKTQVFSVIKL